MCNTTKPQGPENAPSAQTFDSVAELLKVIEPGMRLCTSDFTGWADVLEVHDDGTREYTMEHLLEWDPEVMLVSTRENIEEMKADDRYAGITAVKDDEMYIIPAVAHIWGNRTVEQPLTVLWALHKLYPE